MIEIDNLFENKVINVSKLKANGFVLIDTLWTKGIPLMNNQFQMIVTISARGALNFKLIETETQEEYVLVHVQSAGGSFVSEVRRFCEEQLKVIADTCYECDLIKSEQAKRVIAYMHQTYGANPEYLWGKYPNYSVYRRDDNHKWFAIIMRVEKSKLGMGDAGIVEIIDLKIPVELIDNVDFFPAYHMNKQHWVTICLDGHLKDETIFSYVDASYQSVK